MSDYNFISIIKNNTEASWQYNNIIEGLADHDKHIRDEVISEFRKQLDIKIDFGGLENKLLFFDNYDKIAEHMKGEQNEKNSMYL